jgi:hypothetical protein
MSEKNITIGNETRPMTAEEEAKWTEFKTEVQTQEQERQAQEQQEKEAKDNLKASARAKLMSGEALTEDEAKTVVL